MIPWGILRRLSIVNIIQLLLLSSLCYNIFVLVPKIRIKIISKEDGSWNCLSHKHILYFKNRNVLTDIHISKRKRYEQFYKISAQILQNAKR